MAGSNMTTSEIKKTTEDFRGEAMSALLDGETAHLDEREIKALIEDPSNRDSWARYQLVGDILRASATDPQPVASGEAFAALVREQIESEPTILAPRISTKRNLPKYLQPVAGLALAASVAGVAVIGIQQMTAEDVNDPQQISVANLNAAEQVLAVSSVASPSSDTPELEIDLAEHKRRLNSYLVNFNEQRTSLGMPGVNPYVRIIDFESEK
ncbi:MAG: sigma-E factor negative regulatory protein [Gammaproteobacteria bacterium]